MIERDHNEWNKRPLSRPLFLWIVGTLCEVCYPLQYLSFVLLIPAIAALVCNRGRRSAPRELRLETPYIWGAILTFVILFLAIQRTALAERHLDDPRPAPTAWRRAAHTVQGHIVERLGQLRLSPDEHAVLASITVNDRSGMTRDLRRRFSTAGVAHLLAVSGFHVGLVSGALALLLGFLPPTTPCRLFRCGLMILVAWAYAAVSGLSAPAVRAATMLTIYLVGVALRRTPEPYNTLFASALLMLFVDPFSLFDVGFQLTFAAVLFILLLTPRIACLIDVRRRWIALPWRLVAVSLAAQVGTFPLCCYYFGRISLVFLFANLFLMLSATLLIPLALVWVALPVGTPESFGLQSAVERLTHTLVAVVDRFSLLPAAGVPMRFDLVLLIGSYAVLLLGIHAATRGSRRTLFASLGGTLSLIVYTLAQHQFGG